MAGTLTQRSLLDLDTPRPSLLDTLAEERAASRVREPEAGAALAEPSLDGPPAGVVAGAAGGPTLAEPSLDGPPAGVVAGADGGPTLEDLVTGAWGALQAGEPAACLACGTTLTPRYGAGARPLAGRCGGCGSELR